jgi:hypothetical protein
MLFSLLRARSREETLELSEADLLELPDRVLEIHVHAVFSEKAHVDVGVVRRAADVCKDHVGAVALELWYGALATVVHCWRW